VLQDERNKENTLLRLPDPTAIVHGWPLDIKVSPYLFTRVDLKIYVLIVLMEPIFYLPSS
jgi:hypothetical protein